MSVCVYDCLGNNNNNIIKSDLALFGTHPPLDIHAEQIAPHLMADRMPEGGSGYNINGWSYYERSDLLPVSTPLSLESGDF